jgi:Zn-finger nucleic acid-binding protein
MVVMRSMPCPRCGKPLGLEQDPHGALWRCSECSGVAANLAVLRRHLEEGVARDFWRRATQASAPSKRHCPSCDKPLREFVAAHENQSLRLDLCRPCQLMWFDPGELETFPESKKVTPSEIDQQLALANIQAGPAIGDHMIDSPTERFANYVEVGLQVLMLLLRLFR